MQEAAVEYFQLLWTYIQDFELPFLKLDPRTKLIALLCAAIIIFRFVVLAIKILVNITIRTLRNFIRKRRLRQIENICEIFDEKVNLDSKPIDDFYYFFEKSKDQKNTEELAALKGHSNNINTKNNNGFISSER